MTVAATSALQAFEINNRWQKFRGISWYKDIDNVNQVYVGEEASANAGAVAAYMGPLFPQIFVGIYGGENWGDGWPTRAALGEIQFFVSSARFDYKVSTVIGFRYAAEDSNLEKIVQVASWNASYAATIAPVAADEHEYSATGSLVGTGSLKLSRFSVASGALVSDLATHAMSINASWSAAAPGTSVWSGSYSLNGVTTTVSYSAALEAGSDAPSVPLGVVASAMGKHGSGCLICGPQPRPNLFILCAIPMHSMAYAAARCTLVCRVPCRSLVCMEKSGQKDRQLQPAAQRAILFSAASILSAVKF